MSVIWDFDFEGGDLAEFGGQSGSDMSASAGAALAGTNYGIAVLVDDTTDNYCYPTALASPNTAGKFRCRFYLDPNGLTMGASDTFTLFAARYSTSNFNLALVSLTYSSGAYRLFITIYNDAAGVSASSNYEISDAAHYIEIYLLRATGTSANDGSLQLWIDGTSKETISGIDNYDRFANFNSFRIGAFATKDAGTSGTFYLDQIVVNDDGGEIGPVAATSSAVPVIMRQYRMRRQ